MTDVAALKLTDNQSLTLTYLAAATQAGLYTDETGTFGTWFDSLNVDLVGTVPTKAQAKASLNQLVKKRIFEADTTVEEGSTWLTLTDLGREVLEAFGEDDTEEAAPEAEEAPEEAPVEEATPAADEAPEEEEEDLLGGDDDEDLLGNADEEEDLLGDVADILDKDSTSLVVTHTENYTVNERTDDDGTEWTETVFADGSRTIKRRRLVSESWRTDYWGVEFPGDKEKATTAKLAKAARAYGRFTHEPHVPIMPV